MTRCQIGFWAPTLEGYPRPENFVASDWTEEKMILIRILKLLYAFHYPFRVAADHKCYLCDFSVGGIEYCLKKKGVKDYWIVPGNLLHYLEIHNVRPPETPHFIDFLFSGATSALIIGESEDLHDCEMG